MNWNFHLPVELVFGSGTRHEIKSYIEKIGGTRGVLVCGKSFLRNGTADAFLQAADGALVSVFSDIRPNPTTGNVNACAAEMRRVEADFAVALGGGSPMDCCKAACAIARGTDNIEPYHNGDKPVTAEEAIPMIAFATTAGTASEVTNVAAGVKKPMNHPAMYPKIAVVDPELTLTVPPQVTASTGLDVLCHAVESYWSVNHQPVCAACSVHAARLVFDWLEKAYRDGNDLEAREKMAEASIVALARDCGFDSPAAMADAVHGMKNRMGMRTNLCELGVESDAEIRALAHQSMSMLMTLNPVPLTEENIYQMFCALK